VGYDKIAMDLRICFIVKEYPCLTLLIMNLRNDEWDLSKLIVTRTIKKRGKKPCFFPCSEGSKVKKKGDRDGRSMNCGEKAMDGRRKGSWEEKKVMIKWKHMVPLMVIGLSLKNNYKAREESRKKMKIERSYSG